MGQSNIKAALQAQGKMFTEPPTKIAILENEIAKGDYDLANDIPIEMSESEKTEYRNGWCNYQERNYNPEKNISQAFSLILGQ